MRRIRRLALAGAAALACGRARGEPPAFLLKDARYDWNGAVKVKDATLQGLTQTMDRAFPLWRDAVDWRTVNFTRYSKIIVSGPQRSGTTWFAWSLATHLGYLHLDEREEKKLPDQEGRNTIKVNYGNARSVADMATIVRSPAKVVMQRPMWSHALHKLPPHPSILVIFLARNCLDVFRSQNRIMSSNISDQGWTCKYGRTLEWHWYHVDATLRKHLDSEHDMICAIKQQAYMRYQRGQMDKLKIANVPVDYASSQTMSSFVPVDARQKLKPKQIASSPPPTNESRE